MSPLSDRIDEPVPFKDSVQLSDDKTGFVDATPLVMPGILTSCADVAMQKSCCKETKCWQHLDLLPTQDLTLMTDRTSSAMNNGDEQWKKVQCHLA